MTPREIRLAKDAFVRSRNKALSFHSFGKVPNWTTLFELAGVCDANKQHFNLSVQHEGKPTREDIFALYKPYEEHIEQLGKPKAVQGSKELQTSHRVEASVECTRYDSFPQASYSLLPAYKEVVVDQQHVIDLVKSEEQQFIPAKKQKCKLRPYQERAAQQLYDGITNKRKRGQLLLAPTGSGKTYIFGALLAKLVEDGFHRGRSLSPWPYVIVTKAPIVEQTKYVMREKFGLNTVTDVQVINIEQLRANFGERFVRSKTVVEGLGEEHFKWEWRAIVFPMLLLLDECQILKNTDSQQSQIIQGYNDLVNEETYQVYSSATPFTRVVEAKCFAVATRKRTKYGILEGAPLVNSHFNDYAQAVTQGIAPDEYSPTACERLMKDLEDYVVQVKNVRPQFDAVNTTQIISFQNDAERKFYQDAYDRYLAEKARIEGEQTLSASQTRMQILVQFLKFRQAAELCRAGHLARAMWDCVHNNNQAGVCAVNFKPTIIKIVKILVQEYGVHRDDISLIWGGGATGPSKKQKTKAAIQDNDELAEMLREAGIDLASLKLEDVEDFKKEELDPAYRLGVQSKKMRQEEIDRFQSGKAKYCIFTFKSGGVGLSLHHTDEFTQEKVRLKPSGFAVEEDIPLIPVRQRVCFLAPTYSALEMVQGLGRCPRLTSLSNTPQHIIFYRDTIEERVAEIVSVKLRCLRKVIRANEKWESVIIGGYAQDDGPRTTGDEDEDSTVALLGEGDIDV